MTTVLERLTSIADGIQEIYPTAKASIAISLPLSDIEELCANDTDWGSTAIDIIKEHGASVLVRIRGMEFIIDEIKVDPNLN